MKSNLVLNHFDCECDKKYSIEPHGNGYALYYGRCCHFHGENLLHITEVHDLVILESIENILNDYLREHKRGG